MKEIVNLRLRVMNTFALTLFAVFKGTKKACTSCMMYYKIVDEYNAVY